MILVFPDGNWIYDWEVNSFVKENGVVPPGTTTIDLNKTYKYGSLADYERTAILEALEGQANE